MSSLEFKKILVPVDFSETSLNALDRAVDLARLNNAEITMVHVCETYPLPIEDGILRPENYKAEAENIEKNYKGYEDRLVAEASEKLDKLVSSVKKKGIKVTYLIEAGKVDKQILKIAKRLKSDLIVMGTHGVKGFKEFVVGSNTYRIVRQADCPVLSMQATVTKNSFKRIIIPFRDKRHSRESVDYAIRLAKIYGAAVHVLGIDTEKAEEHFERIRAEAVQIQKLVTKASVPCTYEVIPSSFVTRIILKHASQDRADLMAIVSDMDKMSISEFFTGPVIKQIVNHSTLPILSIRPAYNPKATPAVG